MKRILAGLVCLLASASPDVVNAERANSLRGGAWALQFAITDFVSLDEFAGGISMKRHFSDKSAIRFGVEGRGSTSSIEYSDDPIENSNEGYGLTISSIYQRYIDPVADANFYWGVGPLVGWEHFTLEASSDSLLARDENTTTTVGLGGVVGIEWFAMRVISFHAEYTANGVYRRNTSARTLERTGFPTDESSRAQESWAFTTGGVRFGLSVYF